MFTFPIRPVTLQSRKETQNQRTGQGTGCRRFYLPHRLDRDDWISLLGDCVE